MKNTFTQPRELLSDTDLRLKYVKNTFIKNFSTKNTYERWKENSSTASLGYEFDIANTI